MYSLTYDFTTLDALQAHIDLVRGTTTPRVVIEPVGGAPEPAKPLAMKVEAPKTDKTPAPAETQEITYEMLLQELREYVQKPGKTALMAKTNIFEPHGIDALRNAKPEQYQALYNAFKTAV